MGNEVPALLQTTKNGICDERKKYSQILKKKSGLSERNERRLESLSSLNVTKFVSTLHQLMEVGRGEYMRHR
jgi:hypothetical protein